MINNVTLVGRLVKDIEEKEINNVSVYNFTLAVTVNKELSYFFSCSAWNPNETVANRLGWCEKGDLVVIEGSLAQKQNANSGYPSTYISLKNIEKIKGVEKKEQTEQPKEQVIDDDDPF